MKKNKYIRRMLKSKFFIIGFVLTLLIICISILAPYIAPFSATESNLADRLLAPEWFSKGASGHIFGTDALGRDMLSRVLVGSRSSLIISFSTVFLAALIGTVLGLYSGYYGGIVDQVIMRFSDIQLSIPALILAIAVISILGSSIPNLIVVMTIGSWVKYTRLVRGNVLLIRENEFVSASKILGASNKRIMFSQILPNVTTSLIIMMSQEFGNIILLEAGLSFLGLGVQPSTPSWGGMISDGRAQLEVCPWVVIVPGIALVITVLALNFLGDGIRDVLDPKNTD